MSKFGSKEEILRVIESRFDQMRTSRLSMEDLETLVENARELYERTLILRYKAYEEKVFGEMRDVLEQEAPAPSPAAIVEESSEAAVEPEIVIEEESPASVSEETPVSEAEPETEPVFDFSLFDESEEQQLPIFDHEPVAETPAAEPAAPEMSESELTIEESPAPEIMAEEIAEPEEEQASPEPAMAETNQSGDGLFASVWQDDNSLASRLSLSKLDTLLGSFGFNERFQVVQELFKGSTEDFNQAIEVLDNLTGKEEAEQQLLYYVRLNSWDLESEVAVEFIRKIERRYL